jgi:hypothetical protein
MGETNKKSVRVATWIAPVAATLLIGIMSLTIRGSVRAGNMEANIENNTNNIERLDEDKAEVDAVDRNYDAILRIEQKLDNYIMDHK